MNRSMAIVATVVAAVVAIVLVGVVLLFTLGQPTQPTSVPSTAAPTTTTTATASATPPPVAAPPVDVAAVEPSATPAPTPEDAPAAEADGSIAMLTLKGRVLLPDGSSAPGAKITSTLIKIADGGGSAATGDSTVSADDGSYELRFDGPIAMVVAAKEGYGNASATIAPKDGQSASSPRTVEQDLTLGVEAPFAGTIYAERDGQRTPLGGAFVRVMSKTGGPREGTLNYASYRETTTGADGTFRMAGLSAGDHIVEVEAAGFAAKQVDVTLPAEGFQQTLIAGGTGAIAGVVVSPQGKPIEGAAIQLMSQGSNPAQPNQFQMRRMIMGEWKATETTTDAAGAFRIENLPLGDIYIVSASKGGEDSSPVHESATVGKNSESLRLVLRGEMLILGRVVSAEDNAPLEGVVVSTVRPHQAPNPNEKQDTATTDADGRFTLTTSKVGINMGETVLVTLGATKDGWVFKKTPGNHNFSGEFHAVEMPKDGSPANTEITMARAITISGKVRWAQGRAPIKGTVAKYQRNRGMAESGIAIAGDGTFKVPVVPFDSYMIVAKVADYGDVGSKVIDVLDQDVTGVEIVLEPLGKVSGVVLSPDGEPVEGATLTATEYVGDQGMRWGSGVQHDKPSDAQGAFTIEGLVPGRVEVKAIAPGFAMSADVEFDLGPGEHRTDVEVRLRVANFIAGRVVDGDDKPIVGGRVRAYDYQGYNSPWDGDGMVTKKDGSFRIEGVPDGTELRLAINWDEQQHDWEPSEVVLNDPKAVFVAKAKATVTVIASVLDAQTGDPVRNLVVKRGGGWEPEPIIEDADLGIFRLEDVKPNYGYEYMLSAEGYPSQKIGYSELSIPDDVQPGDILQRTFKLGKAASVVGRIVSEPGNKPVDGLTVLLRKNYDRWNNSDAQEVQKATTGADGRFSFDNVAPGGHAVEVRPEAPLVEHMEEFELAGAASHDLGDIVLGAGKALNVRVKNAAGNAKPGVVVELFRGPAYVGKSVAKITTDAQGLAAFVGISNDYHYLLLPDEGFYINLDRSTELPSDIVVPTGTAKLAVVVKQGDKVVTNEWRPAASMQLAPNVTMSPQKEFTPVDSQTGARVLANLPAGKWSAHIYRDNTGMNRPPQKNVELVNGQTTEAVFSLNSSRLHGVVQTADGKPARGVAVLCESEISRESATTNAEGVFDFKALPPGTHGLVARHKELGFAQQADIEIAPESVVGPITLKLENKATGTLRSIALTEETNEPIAAAWCYVRPVGSVARLPDTAKRDSKGVIEIADIPAGEYDIEVSYWSFSADTRRVTIEPGKTTEVTSTLYASGAIRWRVADAEGNPVMGAEAVLTPAPDNTKGAEHAGTSNANGEIIIRGLRPGKYLGTVTSRLGNKTADITITSGQLVIEETTFE